MGNRRLTERFDETRTPYRTLGCRNMLRAISKEEGDQMDKDTVKWVKKILKTKHGTYIYNILIELKHFIEEIERNERPLS